MGHRRKLQNDTGVPVGDGFIEIGIPGARDVVTDLQRERVACPYYPLRADSFAGRNVGSTTRRVSGRPLLRTDTYRCIGQGAMRVRRIGLVGRLGEIKPQVPRRLELLVAHLVKVDVIVT